MVLFPPVDEFIVPFISENENGASRKNKRKTIKTNAFFIYITIKQKT